LRTDEWCRSTNTLRVERTPRSLPEAQRPSGIEPPIEALRTAVAALRPDDAPSAALDAVARATERVLAAAEEARRDALRCRALLDGICEGVAETDATGVVRIANQRLASLLEVAPDFLAGRPLLHFIARGDCRPFRDVIAAASRGEHEGTVVRFLPRRGATLFAAEVRARAVGPGPRCSIVWTVRPSHEPRARAGSEEEETAAAGSLDAIVDAARQSILEVATARRIIVTNARPTTLSVDPKRARSLLDAMVDLARIALRLASDGATLAVDIQRLAGEEALVAFGAAALRVPLRVKGELGDSAFQAEPVRRAG
jgi:PAS domain-containing protein